MCRIIRCDNDDFDSLAGIWERSVRATHGFLCEDAFREIKSALIPLYFPNVELFAIEVNGIPKGFTGLSGYKIEMLFIDNDSRGKGYGSLLVDFAKSQGARMVDVNEQNQAALEFYKSKKFKVIGRDETDDAGRPYTILHLSL